MKKALCGMLLFLSLAPLSGQEKAWSDWLSLRPEALAAWSVGEQPGNGALVTLRLKESPPGSARKVLVLFPKKSSAYNTALETILRVFLDNHLPASFTCLFYGNDEERGRAALRFAEAERYDLIFSMGSDATALVHKHYRNGALPVVTVCSKDPVLRGQLPDYESGSKTNIAYTSLDMSTKLQLEYLLKLNRGLKHIIILYAAENKSVVDTQVIPLRSDSRVFGIVCHEVVVEDKKKAKEELAEKMGRLIETIKAVDPGFQRTVFWITGATEVFGEIETIVRSAGAVPVLSVVPDVVQAGDNSAVLSLGISFESNAHKAALYALDILTGEAKAGDLPVGVISPPDMAINFRKARAIGLLIPFSFFENATIVFDNDGLQVRPAKTKQP